MLKIDEMEYTIRSREGNVSLMVRYCLCPTDPALAGMQRAGIAPEPHVGGESDEDIAKIDALNVSVQSAFDGLLDGSQNGLEFSRSVLSALNIRHGIE